MFAVHNTVEPPILSHRIAALLDRNESRYAERLPIPEHCLRVRLGHLSSRPGDADWLDDAFRSGDLAMATVRRGLSRTSLLDECRILSAYAAVVKRSPPSTVLSTLNWRRSLGND